MWERGGKLGKNIVRLTWLQFKNRKPKLLACSPAWDNSWQDLPSTDLPQSSEVGTGLEVVAREVKELAAQAAVARDAFREKLERIEIEAEAVATVVGQLKGAVAQIEPIVTQLNSLQNPIPPRTIH